LQPALKSNAPGLQNIFYWKGESILWFEIW